MSIWEGYICLHCEKSMVNPVWAYCHDCNGILHQRMIDDLMNSQEA